MRSVHPWDNPWRLYLWTADYGTCHATELWSHVMNNNDVGRLGEKYIILVIIW